MATKTTKKPAAKKTSATTTTTTPNSVEAIAAALDEQQKTGGTLPGRSVGGSIPPLTTPAAPTTVPGVTPSSPTAAGSSAFAAGWAQSGQGGGGQTSASQAVATIILGQGWDEAIATQPNLLNMTGLDALVGRTPGWNATPTIGPKTAVEVIRWARALPAAQFARLQQALYAAHYYPEEMYRASQVPMPGDRLADADWENALWKALGDNARAFDTTRNPQAFGDLIEARKRAAAPLLAAIAQDKAAAAAADTLNKQKQAEAEAARNAAMVANAKPADVMGTQLLQLSNPTDIAAAAQDTAVKLLGRRLTAEEESAYVQSISAAEKAALTQQADVKAFNEQLGWTYPNGTATNPQQNAGSAQPSAPESQYTTYDPNQIRTDGSSDSRVTGLDPRFGSALIQFQAAARDAGFDIVVGSGHRTEAEQTALYNASDKSGKMVGTPKGSKHVKGQAGDLRVNGKGLGSKGTEAATKWAHENAAKFGLTFPMSYEPWHIEHVTARNGSAAPTATASKTATPAATGPVSADQLAEALALEESGNQNIVTKAKGSSASGYFQITDATWGKYKGYARAIDAPREIQKERATQLLSGYLTRFGGDVDMTLAAYYAGGGNSDAKLRSMITNNTNPTAGTQTANKNMQKFLSDVKVNLPKVTTTTTTATNPSLGGPGGSLARGVTPYAGAVTTPSGGSVLYQTTPATVANTVEADLRKHNPGELAAQSVLNARAVFQQLFGGI